MRYLVTGGAGFIGSNFIRFLFNKYGSDASGRESGQAHVCRHSREPGRVRGEAELSVPAGRHRQTGGCGRGIQGVDGSGVDVVVNFAAETHVDRSLMEAGSFIETDVHGVLVLLEEARKNAPDLKRFIQISTDEVYGSIDEGSFTENDPLNPRNPYSASKAGGDRMAYAYAQTFGMPVIITRASNNYRPVPVPGEADPALRHERHRRSAAAALRRRRKHPRLAVRRGPLRSGRLPDRARHELRDLQHRRRQRAREPRDHAPHPASSSASRNRSSSASPTASGPRPPLLGRHLEAGEPRLQAAPPTSTPPSSAPCSGTSTTSRGGAPSRSAARSTRRTTRSNTRGGEASRPSAIGGRQ